MRRPLEGGRQRQRNHLNAFFCQRHLLLHTGLATDATLLAFTIVDATRFLGKAVTHVLGCLENMGHGPQPLGLQFRLDGACWRDICRSG